MGSQNGSPLGKSPNKNENAASKNFMGENSSDEESEEKPPVPTRKPFVIASGPNQEAYHGSSAYEEQGREQGRPWRLAGPRERPKTQKKDQEETGKKGIWGRAQEEKDKCR